MSIFGKLDAAQIPSNPFFIKEGEYEAEVTNAYFKSNRDNVNQLHIEYTITSEDSEFKGSKATQYFNLIDPNMTNEDIALLPADEQRNIRKSLSNLKRTLCGNEGNTSQRGLGVDIEDLEDENWNPEVLKGTKVNMAINNFGTQNEGVGIRWVNLIQQ